MVQLFLQIRRNGHVDGHRVSGVNACVACRPMISTDDRSGIFGAFRRGFMEVRRIQRRYMLQWAGRFAVLVWAEIDDAGADDEFRRNGLVLGPLA